MPGDSKEKSDYKYNIFDYIDHISDEMLPRFALQFMEEICGDPILVKVSRPHEIAAIAKCWTKPLPACPELLFESAKTCNITRLNLLLPIHFSKLSASQLRFLLLTSHTKLIALHWLKEIIKHNGELARDILDHHEFNNFFTEQQWYEIICQDISFIKLVVQHLNLSGLDIDTRNPIEALKQLLLNPITQTSFCSTHLELLLRQQPELVLCLFSDLYFQRELYQFSWAKIIRQHPLIAEQLIHQWHERLTTDQLVTLIKNNAKLVKLIIKDKKFQKSKNRLNFKYTLLTMLHKSNIAVAEIIFGEPSLLASLDYYILTTIMAYNIDYAILVLRHYNSLQYSKLKLEEIIRSVIKHSSPRFLLDFLQQNPLLKHAVKEIDDAELYLLFGIDGILELYQGEDNNIRYVTNIYLKEIVQGPPEVVIKRLGQLAEHNPTTIPLLLKIEGAAQYLWKYFAEQQPAMFTKHPALIFIKISILPPDQVSDFLNWISEHVLKNPPTNLIISNQVMTFCRLLLKQHPHHETLVKHAKLLKAPLTAVELELVFGILFKFNLNADTEGLDFDYQQRCIFISALLEEHLKDLDLSSGAGLVAQTFIAAQPNDKLIKQIAERNLAIALKIALKMTRHNLTLILELIEDNFTKIEFDTPIGNKLKEIVVEHAPLELFQLLKNNGVCFHSSAMLAFIVKQQCGDILRALIVDGLVTLETLRIVLEDDKFSERRLYFRLLEQWQIIWDDSLYKDMRGFREVVMLEKFPEVTLLRTDAIYIVPSGKLSEDSYLTVKFKLGSELISNQIRFSHAPYFKVNTTIALSRYDDFMKSFNPFFNSFISTQQDVLKKCYTAIIRDAVNETTLPGVLLNIVTDYLALPNLEQHSSIFELREDLENIAIAHFATIEIETLAAFSILKANYHFPNGYTVLQGAPIYSKLYYFYCFLSLGKIVVTSDEHISQQIKNERLLKINAALQHFKPMSLAGTSWQTNVSIPIILEKLFYERVRNSRLPLEFSKSSLRDIDIRYRHQLSFWQLPSTNTHIKKIALDNMHRFIQSQRSLLKDEDIQSLYDFIKTESKVVKYRQFNCGFWDNNYKTRSQVRAESLKNEAIPDEPTYNDNVYGFFNRDTQKIPMLYQAISTEVLSP